jgi:hypothetical protein
MKKLMWDSHTTFFTFPIDLDCILAVFLFGFSDVPHWIWDPIPVSNGLVFFRRQTMGLSHFS